MHIKICSKCRSKKPLLEFYFRKKGPRAGKYYEKCIDCMKLRGRNYYRANRDRQLNLALLRREKYRSYLRAYTNEIKNVICADCGVKYPPYVMDFDHRDPKAKSLDVGRMINGGWSKKKIDDEITKCDIICSNCHRIRTYGNKVSAEVAKVVKARV